MLLGLSTVWKLQCWISIMLYIKHATNNIYGLDVVFVPCSSLYKEQVLPKEVEIANRYQILLLSCEGRKLGSLRKMASLSVKRVKGQRLQSCIMRNTPLIHAKPPIHLPNVLSGQVQRRKGKTIFPYYSLSNIYS
jgi:hypothetical protein